MCHRRPVIEEGGPPPPGPDPTPQGPPGTGSAAAGAYARFDRLWPDPRRLPLRRYPPPGAARLLRRACLPGAARLVVAGSQHRPASSSDPRASSTGPSIPAGFVAALLRHFKWSAARVQDACFSDEPRVRAAVSLPPPADGAAPSPTTFTSASTAGLVCAICFAWYPVGETRSAACGAHFYCAECWRSYIGAAVGEGTRCP